MKKVLLLLSFIIFAGLLSYSQSNMSFKATIFQINPSQDSNKPLYKDNFLDTTGFFTIHPGFQMTAEVYGCKIASFKVVQSIAKDQVGHFAGFSQVLVSIYLAKNRTNYWKVGIGPAVHYRQTWTIFPEYIDEGYYYDYSTVQYKMNWVTFEVEYGWKRNKDWDYTISLSQIYPRSASVYFGLKYWFTRRNHNCTTCPSFG